MVESNWVVELLNSLEEDKLKELLRTVALITDPLSQELMKKAIEGTDVDIQGENVKEVR